VTNVAVKSSPVNISGFNREIPVSMNQDVIFGCVMNRSKVWFMTFRRWSAARLCPGWRLSQKLIPVSKWALNIR
jgi:hypothetical protein